MGHKVEPRPNPARATRPGPLPPTQVPEDPSRPQEAVPPVVQDLTPEEVDDDPTVAAPSSRPESPAEERPSRRQVPPRVADRRQ